MGIKDLRSFLKSKKVDCFYSVPLDTFSGKRIGIDALNWLFCYLGNCVKSIITYKKDILQEISQEEIYDKLISEFLNFNIKFLNCGITPVWIWDGVSKDNKDATKKSRREAKLKIIEKRDNIYKILKDSNPLERSWELMEEYKKLLINSVSISRDKINDLKNFSSEIGIPTITAKEEGESLGASLAAARILSAFWSADTDVYPLGCPVAIKGFEYVNNSLHINCVFTPLILKRLKLNHAEFRDFCILLGTDFNDRIYKVGPVKSYQLIDKYRNLETVEKESTHNCECLNYKEVRELFYSYKTEYTGFGDLDFDKNIDKNYIKEKYERFTLLDRFLELVKYLVKPENVPK